MRIDRNVKAKKIIKYTVAVVIACILIVAVVYAVRSKEKSSEIKSDTISETGGIEGNNDIISEDDKGEVADGEYTTIDDSAEDMDTCEIVRTSINKILYGDVGEIYRYYGESNELYNVVCENSLGIVIGSITKKDKKNNEVDVVLKMEDSTKVQGKSKDIRERLKEQNVAITDEQLEGVVRDRIRSEVIDSEEVSTKKISIRVEDNKVVVTEELKEILTNNKYKGVE